MNGVTLSEISLTLLDAMEASPPLRPDFLDHKKAEETYQRRVSNAGETQHGAMSSGSQQQQGTMSAGASAAKEVENLIDFLRRRLPAEIVVEACEHGIAVDLPNMAASLGLEIFRGRRGIRGNRDFDQFRAIPRFPRIPRIFLFLNFFYLFLRFVRSRMSPSRPRLAEEVFAHQNPMRTTFSRKALQYFGARKHVRGTGTPCSRCQQTTRERSRTVERASLARRKVLGCAESVTK